MKSQRQIYRGLLGIACETTKRTKVCENVYNEDWLHIRLEKKNPKESEKTTDKLVRRENEKRHEEYEECGFDYETRMV